METRRKFRYAIACGVALVATSLPFTAGVSAAEEPSYSAQEIAAVAVDAAGVAGTPTSVAGDAVAADLGAVEVEVPLAPDEGLVIAPDDGPAIAIGLPGAPAETGATVGGAVVYEEVAPDSAVVARPTSQGVQAMVVIEGADAPTEFRFPIDLGTGVDVELVLAPSGGVEVRVRGELAAVALVLPAWATDAEGQPVPTHFEVEGTTLVQVVDHAGAAYPVVADPATCGTVTCTQYFNKAVTKDVASAGSWGLACGVLLHYVKPAGVGCIVAWVGVHTQAVRARNRGMCLKIKYTRFGPTVWWPDIYSGKYCK